jgi:hypothetical protein
LPVVALGTRAEAGHAGDGGDERKRLDEKPEGIVMFPLSALSGEFPWVPSVMA